MDKNLEQPLVSIVVPVYDFPGGLELAKRNLDSIDAQDYENLEVVITDDSDDNVYSALTSEYRVNYARNYGPKGMAYNTNHGIDNAKGELIKILFQDDFFSAPDSLRSMVQHLTPTYNWLASGCYHTVDGTNLINYHAPFYSHSENTIGSPSVTLFRNQPDIRFNTNFHWVLDLDLYRKLMRKYGKPKILETPNVVIGLHEQQMTHKLTDERKFQEFLLLEMQNYE